MISLTRARSTLANAGLVESLAVFEVYARSASGGIRTFRRHIPPPRRT